MPETSQHQNVPSRVGNPLPVHRLTVRAVSAAGKPLPVPAGTAVEVIQGPCVVKIEQPDGTPLYAADHLVLEDGIWQATGTADLLVKLP